MKEDKASWVNFFQWLRGRGLDGVKLIVGDKCMGMLEAVGEVFPDAKYQRCTVHFYRNVFSVVPKSKVKIVAKMLKAIHAQESKKASREKAKAVVAELRAMKLKEAAGNVKKCAVGKHPKSEKHGNTAQFSEVERSGTQENCGGIGSGCRLRLRPLPVLRRRQSQRVARIDPNAVVVDKNIAENDRFDLFSR